MNRRRLLGLVGGVGVAGSVGVVGQRRAGKRRIAVASVDQWPGRLPVTATVEMVRQRATNAQPGIVRVSITNESEEPYDELVTGYPGVFTVARSTEEEPGLELSPLNGGNRELRHPLCPKPLQNQAIPAGAKGVDLDPGETDSMTFAVWGQLENDPFECVPPGTYTFTSNYDHGPKLERTFEWGFELDVRSR